uniref:NopRA1 domain-containing protein n=1 Tax=Caenorhabditis japonica TaxID=281687 RepID=A0A8R1HQ74_CAEJA
MGSGTFRNFRAFLAALKTFFDAATLWNTTKYHVRPVTDDNAEKIYDVRFVLRFFNSILYPASPLSSKLFVERNCLALLFSCTSSTDSAIRTLAFACLQKFVNHLQELNTEVFTEKPLVLYLIRLFKHSFEASVPRISSIITHFFARVSKLMLHPSNDVYPQIMAFLCMKPIFDVQNVPEFYKLLFSSSPEHHNEEREWILTLISEAMLEPLDYQVLQNRAGMKLLLSSFSSIWLERKGRALILRTLQNAVHMPSVAHDLFNREGLHIWIAAVIHVNWVPNEEQLVKLVALLADAKDDVEAQAKLQSVDLKVLTSLLTAYRATCCDLDMSIFSILQFLEKYGCNFSDLQPLVFGEEARKNYENLRKMGLDLHVRIAPDDIWEWSGPELKTNISGRDDCPAGGELFGVPDKPVPSWRRAPALTKQQFTCGDVRRPFLPYVTYDEHRDSVTDACWPSNDFDVFMSCGKDGLIVLHNIDSGHAPINYACDVAFDITPDGCMGLAVNSEIHAKNYAMLEEKAIGAFSDFFYIFFRLL